MTITLKEGHFSSFFQTPFVIYGPDVPFVSPLRSELRSAVQFSKNPFFPNGDGIFYTAFQDGKLVGRICAHVHHAANMRHGERAASFGYFDCVDDGEVAQALLEAAEAFGRARGCDLIRGNMNLTAHQEIGVLTEGAENPPFLAQIYTPAHIAGLLEACGYTASKPMTSFIKDDLETYEPERLLGARHRDLMQQDGFVFRPFDMRRFAEETERIREVLNAAMQENYLYMPMTAEQARFQLGPLKMIMDPSLVMMAEHDGDAIGVTLCLPDINPMLRQMRSRLWPWGWWTALRMRRRLKGASIIIILVKPAYQSRGVTRVLTYLLMQALQQGGYTHVGGTWIGDDNLPSLRSAQAVGMKPYHRLHMYEKSLS
ncbi:MAG: GNAT family N-acetyltransferase [Myxococcota bacterium]